MVVQGHLSGYPFAASHSEEQVSFNLFVQNSCFEEVKIYSNDASTKEKQCYSGLVEYGCSLSALNRLKWILRKSVSLCHLKEIDGG